MAKKPQNKMPGSIRAKQFMPFAALKGYDEALKKKEKFKTPKKVLSEDQIYLLNIAINSLEIGSIATIIYYKNYEYIQSTGIVESIDKRNHTIQLSEVLINFNDITDIE